MTRAKLSTAAVELLERLFGAAVEVDARESRAADVYGLALEAQYTLLMKKADDAHKLALDLESDARRLRRIIDAGGAK
mgnify:CR=1 FL=1